MKVINNTDTDKNKNLKKYFNLKSELIYYFVQGINHRC